jgi:hypothetical protein
MAAWIHRIINRRAICALQQEDGPPVAIPRHAPHKRPGRNSIGVSAVKIILAMAPILRAHICAMVYERDGLASENHPARLPPQRLSVAPRNI